MHNNVVSIINVFLDIHQDQTMVASVQENI